LYHENAEISKYIFPITTSNIHANQTVNGEGTGGVWECDQRRADRPAPRAQNLAPPKLFECQPGVTAEEIAAIARSRIPNPRKNSGKWF
jgi:hypothetical protein